MGAAGMVRNIVEETRAGDRSQVTEADDGRQFYQLHPAKRIVVMMAGPVMNLILAVGIFGVLMVGIGVPTQSTTVATVSQCVIPAAAAGHGAADRVHADRPGDPGRDRRAAARATPSSASTAIAVTSWDQLTDLIRASAGQTVQLDYVRDGQQVTKAVAIVQNQRPCWTTRASRSASQPPGFLGISVTAPYVQQILGAAIGRTGDFIGAAAKAVVAIPARIPALWNSIFSDAPRDLNSPVGIVGAGRIGGEILDSENTSTTDKWVLFLNLVAGFNMSLFLLNMLPLLPLDGGHILGAMIEWVRKGWAKLRGKKDPGPVRRGQS